MRKCVQRRIFGRSMFATTLFQSHRFTNNKFAIALQFGANIFQMPCTLSRHKPNSTVVGANSVRPLLLFSRNTQSRMLLPPLAWSPSLSDGGNIDNAAPQTPQQTDTANTPHNGIFSILSHESKRAKKF